MLAQFDCMWIVTANPIQVGKTNFAYKMKGRKYMYDMSTDGVDINDHVRDLRLY